MKKWIAAFLSLLCMFSISGCGQQNGNPAESASSNVPSFSAGSESSTAAPTEGPVMQISDEFVLIQGGTFQMGSPEDEPWRSADETQHSVTVSDFYMSKYELTQKEYTDIMGTNPSNFSGDNLPVENVSGHHQVSVLADDCQEPGRYLCLYQPRAGGLSTRNRAAVDLH